MPTFVAITICLPEDLSYSPITVSDSPPRWPGTRAE